MYLNGDLVGNMHLEIDLENGAPLEVRNGHVNLNQQKLRLEVNELINIMVNG